MYLGVPGGVIDLVTGQMIEPDKKVFKDALAKGTFYKDLRTKFGDEAWKLLQDSVGNLG